ncbi:MAG TPA: hypothetical protein VD966_01855, partial [Pyrinomonadaceae bacterium]|nr:hypothetical protein [Pyrinomonadaceae bacterium]
MRFLRRASAVALALLMLLTAASAQTRSRPRNTVDCTAPSLSLAANATIIRLVSCPEGQTGSCTPNTSQPVQLTATASDANPATLRYKYTTSGGRIAGTGPNVTWDLSNVRPGTYRTTVEVDNDCGCVAFATTTVVVAPCPCAPPPCPTITVDCPTSVVEAGSPVTVTANVSGGAVGLSPSYNWSVTDGRITAGQGTTAITIDTTGLGGRTLTATLDVAGVPPNCQRAVSCAVSAGIKPEPRKFDEI